MTRLIRRFVTALTFTLSICASSVVGAANNPTQAEATKDITATAQAFSTAFMNEDIPLLMSFYADEAIVPKDGVSLIGKSEISALWQLDDNVDIVFHQTTSDALIFKDDVVIDYGSYQVQSKTGGELGKVFTGSYTIIWTQDADLNWKMGLDIWNCCKRPD